MDHADDPIRCAVVAGTISLAGMIFVQQRCGVLPAGAIDIAADEIEGLSKTLTGSDHIVAAEMAAMMRKLFGSKIVEKSH